MKDVINEKILHAASFTWSQCCRESELQEIRNILFTALMLNVWFYSLENICFHIVPHLKCQFEFGRLALSNYMTKANQSQAPPDSIFPFRVHLHCCNMVFLDLACNVCFWRWLNEKQHPSEDGTSVSDISLLPLIFKGGRIWVCCSKNRSFLFVFVLKS